MDIRNNLKPKPMNIKPSGSILYEITSTWRFQEGMDISYIGYGRTETEARQQARMRCINSNPAPAYKTVCEIAEPISTKKRCVGDCGTAKTKCIGWGKEVPNPCPSTCTRSDDPIYQELGLLCTIYVFKCNSIEVPCP